jgi:phosphoribulokinase
MVVCYPYVTPNDWSLTTLHIDMETKRIIIAQAAQYDSFYLYDEKKIDEQIEKLKADFSSVDFFVFDKNQFCPCCRQLRSFTWIRRGCGKPRRG